MALPQPYSVTSGKPLPLNQQESHPSKEWKRLKYFNNPFPLQKAPVLKLALGAAGLAQGVSLSRCSPETEPNSRSPCDALCTDHCLLSAQGHASPRTSGRRGADRGHQHPPSSLIISSVIHSRLQMRRPKPKGVVTLVGDGRVTKVRARSRPRPFPEDFGKPGPLALFSPERVGGSSGVPPSLHPQTPQPPGKSCRGPRIDRAE